MKIAFFHELHFGGARRVVCEYAKVFSKNHQVDLFYVDRERENGVEIFFDKNKFYAFDYEKYDGRNFLLKIYKDFLEPIKLYFLHKKIAKDIDNEKYDFVFVHPSQFTHAPFILRFLKTPLVYFCHEPLRIVYDSTVSIPEGLNPSKMLYEQFSRRLRRFIDSSNIKYANLVLANCIYSKENIKRAYSIDAKVCYLGVDIKVFKPINIQKIYDLIFVGDPIYMEGYDTFKEILKLFNHKLKTKVVKPRNGEHISDQELAKEYNKAKILLVLGRNDPFSMIPWEGMACEIVPVVVNEGGQREAVADGETGFLVERNPKQFKKIIERLLFDEKLRSEIGRAGRREVEKEWNWDKSMDRFFEIIKKEL